MEPSKIKLFARLFFLSLGVLFFLSPDSYTHDLYNRIDTAWFYTCGKAWMNGMIPYVDFADSKGPLLWLIYGIGYIFSPHNYIGLFWLSVFLYTFIFYYVFKTAFIFLQDTKWALMSCVIMVAVFFCRWYHYEIRAEDYSLFFVSIVFYRSCLLLYTKEGRDVKSIFVTFFILGIALAATLLMKYNVTIMLGLTAFYLFYVVIRERKNVLISFFSVLGGAFLITLPFVLYLFSVGAFKAFIQEYFLNTMQTIQSYNNSGIYFKEWLFLTYEPLYIILFVIAVIGALLMRSKVKTYRNFFLFSFLAFYSISIHHSSSLRIQYMCICLYFPLWFCISIVHHYKASNALRACRKLAIILVTYTFLSNIFHDGYLCENLFFFNNNGRHFYYETAYFMSQIKKPTIIYFGDMERGQGTPADALPGSKYWSTQMHATDEMYEVQLRDVKKGRADFIMTSNWRGKTSEEYDKLLIASGYHLVYTKYYGSSTHYLYCRYPLRPLPSDFTVSNWDVFFKRNVFAK